MKEYRTIEEYEAEIERRYGERVRNKWKAIGEIVGSAGILIGAALLAFAWLVSEPADVNGAGEEESSTVVEDAINIGGTRQ